VAPGDRFEGVWTFEELSLLRGVRLTAVDRVEAKALTVDSSSSLSSKNLRIPSPGEELPECPRRGPQEVLPGSSPAPVVPEEVR
jgi:hypothetical protein